MSLEPPPIQERTTEESTSRFPLPWLRWFEDVVTCVNAGNSGFGSDGVMDGGRRMNDDSVFIGGRRF